jgi:hypothetical protein
MVFGIVFHALQEVDPVIYLSQFFTEEGNNEYRAIREQSIAAEVSKQFAFRCFCASSSQVISKLLVDVPK